jgi:hypothetical protein
MKRGREPFVRADFRTMTPAAPSERLLDYSPQPLTPPEAARVPVSNVALWFGALGGPISWATHLMVMYPLVEVGCRLQSKAPLYAASAFFFVVALLAALVSGQYVRRMRGQNGATVPRRIRFMASAGFLSAVLFMIVIVGMTLPVLFDDPCQLQGQRRPTLFPHF